MGPFFHNLWDTCVQILLVLRSEIDPTGSLWYIGKDSAEPKYAGIKTTFVASVADRYDSDIAIYEGGDALELRIPMSSFGENQRFRVASERQDRSSDYPVAAASVPSEDTLPQVGSIVKSESVEPYRKPGAANVSMSVTYAQEQGMFRDGILEASNAVVTEPGFSFSIEALHVTPHKFRKFCSEVDPTGSLWYVLPQVTAKLVRSVSSVTVFLRQCAGGCRGASPVSFALNSKSGTL